MTNYRTSTAATVLPLLCALMLDIESAGAQCDGGPESGPENCGKWVNVEPCDFPIGNPCDGGKWPAGLHGTHMILTRGSGPPYPELGKLLIFRHTHGPFNPDRSELAHYWDPRAPEIADPTGVLAANDPLRTLFCAGHVVLPDGRVLVAGGEDKSVPQELSPAGIEDVYIFDPVAFEQSGIGWQKQTNSMQVKRYYPTLTVLQDGRVISSSGQIDKPTGRAQSVEIFDGTNWNIVNSSADFSTWYPFMHVLPEPSIRVLHSGPRDADIDVLEDLHTGSPYWNDVASNLARGWAMSMYGPGLLLDSGGPELDTAEEDEDASRKADITSVSSGGVITVVVGDSMTAPRSQHNLVALPNGEILVVGGNSEHKFGTGVGATGVTTTEIFTPPADPQTGQGQWRDVAPMDHHSPPIPRMYHSTAALLPDGRVLVAGGDDADGCPQPLPGIPPSENCLSADFYEPPYLFRSDGTPIDGSDRPIIQSYPDPVGTGSEFTVTVDPQGTLLTMASMIRPAATTHGNDMDQRLVPLSFSALGGNQFEVTAPATLSDAPPGDYLFFFMNNAGLTGHPSIAKFVNVWGIIESSITEVVTTFCQSGTDRVKLDVSWQTSVASDAGQDKLEVYLPGHPSPCVGAPSHTRTGGTGGTNHQLFWTRTCQTGTYYYHLKNKKGSSETVSECYSFTVTSCPSCNQCPPQGCQLSE